MLKKVKQYPLKSSWYKDRFNGDSCDHSYDLPSCHEKTYDHDDPCDRESSCDLPCVCGSHLCQRNLSCRDRRGTCDPRKQCQIIQMIQHVIIYI